MIRAQETPELYFPVRHTSHVDSPYPGLRTLGKSQMAELPWRKSRKIGNVSIQWDGPDFCYDSLR